jgi:hypothetical protein
MDTPAPSAYTPNHIRSRSAPAYTLAPRVYPPDPGTRTPGPAAYMLYSLHKTAGGAFGIKHSARAYVSVM